MLAYHWIVLALAICGQWGIYATANDDLSKQAEFLADYPLFKFATGRIQPGNSFPLAPITFPIISTALKLAKEKFNGQLLPEYQELDQQCQDIEKACNDFESECSKRFVVFMDLTERYRQMFNYIAGCTWGHSRDCPGQYEVFINYYAKHLESRTREFFDQAKSRVLDLFGKGGKQAEESSNAEQ